MNDFGDLVHQAEHLTSEMDSGGDLPRVERSLHQLYESAQRLASRAPLGFKDSTDTKASILLGARGYDVQKVSQKLEGLSSIKTFEPLETVRDTDIQGFLKNERENALLSAIEQSRKRTFDDTEKRHWECMQNEWELEKQKILSSLVVSGSDIMDFPTEMENSCDESVTLQGRSTLNEIELAYARKVYLYNESVIQGSTQTCLIDELADVSEKLDDRNIEEMWTIVQHMIDVSLSASTSLVTSRSSYKLQKSFIFQAKKYLEQSYVKFITSTIYGNLESAKLGGVPGTEKLVRSFLNVRALSDLTQPGLEDGTIDGHPFWAVVYYCIRCGDLNSALQVVKERKQHLGEFQSFLQEYIDENQNLTTNTETRVKLQYRRVVKNSTDPYKRAVFCIIGKCDPKGDYSEIADKIDDYLWIKLSQLTIDDNENLDQQGDVLTLSQLQTILLEEFGESHFNAYQQPFLYFQVLFLTAQFEAAIEFLSRIEHLRCHAVHIAIVLYVSNLLLIPFNVQSQMSSREPTDPVPMRRLNFARLITLYTRKFEVTDPREALQYFYFLRNLNTVKGESLFLSCVSQLVIETREFDLLLGQMNHDGVRRPGAIDKFHNDTQKILDLVAAETENSGQFEDAVKLYDLAKKHDKVLMLMNRLMTQVLSLTPGTQSNKDRLKSLALNIAERYRALGHKGSAHNTSTFYLLLDLLTFFEAYHSQKFDQAYKIILELKLLPFTAEAIEQKVAAFRHYTDEVRRCLPDILLATMNILYSQYKNTKSANTLSSNLSALNRRQDGGKESHINYLRSQAQALITFSGMIPYRMPGDTNARLVQIEVLMN